MYMSSFPSLIFSVPVCSMLAASETNAGNGSSVSTVSYLSVNSGSDTSNRMIGFGGFLPDV